MRKLLPSRPVRTTLLVFVSLCGLRQYAPAATYYWDNNGATSGFGSAGGTWSSTASLWSTDGTGATAIPGNIVTNNADALNFGTGTSNLGLKGGTITVGGIVSAANFTVGSQSGSITLSGGGIDMGTVTGTFALSGNLNINSVLMGSNGLTKTGNSTLTLGGANTYSGVTTISTRTLAVGNATALGTSTVSVTAGASLDLAGITMTGNNAMTLRGTGNASAGALINSSTTAGTYDGLVTLGAASSIIAGTGNITLSNTGTITGAYGLTVGGAKNTTINSAIASGAGTLTKQDAGILTLIAANTYTGRTTVSGGTLVLGNGSAIPTATAGTAPNGSSVTLGGGQIAFSGNIAAGNDSTTGVGALTLSATSSLNFGGGNDLIHFAASGGIVWTTGTTLNIFNWDSGNDRLLFGTDDTMASLTSAQLGQINFYSGVDTNSTFLGTGAFTGEGIGELTFTQVPEPGTVCGALLCLGFMAFRERRKMATRLATWWTA